MSQMGKLKTQSKRQLPLDPKFENYFDKMLAFYGHCLNWDKLDLQSKITLLKRQRRAAGIPESGGLPAEAYGP